MSTTLRARVLVRNLKGIYNKSLHKLNYYMLFFSVIDVQRRDIKSFYLFVNPYILSTL